MTKPEAVVFDYGNVLSLPQVQACLDEMVALLGGCEDFHAAYWHERLAYDRADLTEQRYWQTVVERCRRELTEDLLARLIDADNRSWAAPNSTMVQFANKLKTQSIPLAILSNMPWPLRKFLPSGCPWLPAFQYETFSCEVESTKPDARIYEHCLTGLGLPPHKVLFIDDRSENVDAARALGMQALLFEETQAVIRDVQTAFGMPVTA